MPHGAADVIDREAATPWAMATRTHIIDKGVVASSPISPAGAVPALRIRPTAKGNFMLCRTMVVLAIALAVSGYTIPTNAFAAGSTFEGGRMASGAKAAHRSGRVLNGYDDERHAGGRHGYQWDPWGHWGAYYGPNPAPL
jgi:hypothetical protein